MRERLISRFRPFLLVGVVLTAWLIFFNLSLTWLQQASLLDWLPDHSTGFGFVLESKQRVDGAIEAYRKGTVRRDKPLMAFVGISDVREGVRLEAVSLALNGRWRLIGVAGAGLGVDGIAEQASLVIDSDLRPDVIIIGISPLQLIDRINFETETHDDSNPFELAHLRGKLRRSFWITRRRADVNGFLDRTIHDARLILMSSFGITAGVDSRSPWRPLLRTLGMERYPTSVLQRELARLRRAGADKLSTYTAGNSAQVQAGDLIRRCKAVSAKVVLVEMPQNPLLLELLPSESHQLLATRLREVTGDPDLLVLNLSNVIGSDGFIDLVHLNTIGGEQFSQILGVELAKYLSPELNSSQRQPAH